MRACSSSSSSSATESAACTPLALECTEATRVYCVKGWPKCNDAATVIHADSGAPHITTACDARVNMDGTVRLDCMCYTGRIRIRDLTPNLFHVALLARVVQRSDVVRGAVVAAHRAERTPFDRCSSKVCNNASARCWVRVQDDDDGGHSLAVTFRDALAEHVRHSLQAGDLVWMEGLQTAMVEGALSADCAESTGGRIVVGLWPL